MLLTPFGHYIIENESGSGTKTHLQAGVWTIHSGEASLEFIEDTRCSIRQLDEPPIMTLFAENTDN
jgi:hypothetical protein